MIMALERQICTYLCEVVISPINNISSMKLSTLIFFAAFLAFSVAIPWKDQIALVNALEVGRNQDPTVWACVGCDETNKPLTTAIMEEKQKDVKAILSVYEEYTVLAFRYTATIKNVAQDILWAFQVQDEHACKGCKVQKQFDSMWNAIRTDILNDLKKSVHTGRLIITGISLGGALSCLSYVDIAKSGIFKNVEIVTFGAPRVGNKVWAEWFDKQTPSTRYYIKADPIAALPRCLTLICNYRQTGTAVVCNKNTQTCKVKANGEDDDEPTALEYLDALTTAVQEHYNEEQFGDVDGIVDHITGYKKIKDYTLIA